jgi:hypothetical protein
VKDTRFLPQFNRLSIVAAMILLAYALLPFIQTPTREISFNLFGILIEFNANFTLAIAFLAAGLAVSGTDWLVRDHPRRGQQSVYPHYLLPALTAAVIGIPLALIKVSIQWWAVFGLGTVLLLAVLVTEYISVDSQDSRYALAQMILNGVSFGLLLTLTISIRAAGLRLYLLLFALIPVFALICLRLFFLRLMGNWNWEWTTAITLIIAQAAIGLYYLPLAPVRYGLVLLGIAYGMVELAIALQPGRWERTIIIGPVLVTGMFWLMAIFLG